MEVEQIKKNFKCLTHIFINLKSFMELEIVKT